MKKNTFKIEKDAFNDNIYYISFDYISTEEFNVRIFFNACENNAPNKNIEYEDKDSNENNLERINRQVDYLKDELIIKEEEINKQENENYLNSNMNKSNFKK